MPTTPVTIPDVEILSQDSLGYRVRVAGRELFVGNLQLAPDHLPPRPGACGVLVIVRESAWDLGLVSRPDRD
jgi:hypothetical protein